MHLGSFASFAATIARSRAYVGYDSAGQHAAAASGAPARSSSSVFNRCFRGEMMAFRVAHVTTIASSLSTLLLNQMRSQVSAGYEVHAISAPGPEVQRLTAVGVKHIAVPMCRTINPAADIVSLLRLVGEFREHRFDVVHTHTPKAGLLGRLAARLSGVPHVLHTIHGFHFHEHMSVPERRLYIALERIAAKCCHRILSQNREDVDVALAHRICGPTQIAFLGNGIDIELFSARRVDAEPMKSKREQFGLPKDVPVVGFVGRLAARRKGVLDFLAAAKSIVEHGCQAHFLVVGPADLGKPDCIHPATTAQRGIEHRCHFVGQQPPEEMPQVYACMNVLVLPSLFEGMPRAIMEAAAMGVPCVATNVKGNREAVLDGITGMLVPLGNTQALARAIEAILASPDRAKLMGLAAREQAEKCFDERLVFNRVLDEYAQLIARA